MTKSQEIHAERMRNRPTKLPAMLPPPRVRAIITAAGRSFNVPPRWIRDSNQRIGPAVAARRHIARQLHALGYSTTVIGYWLGGLHHTSVLYMLKDHEGVKRRGAQRELGPIDYTTCDEWAI
jgi:hypothetical protein